MISEYLEKTQIFWRTQSFFHGKLTSLAWAYGSKKFFDRAKLRAYYAPKLGISDPNNINVQSFGAFPDQFEEIYQRK